MLSRPKAAPEVRGYLQGNCSLSGSPPSLMARGEFQSKPYPAGRNSLRPRETQRHAFLLKNQKFGSQEILNRPRRCPTTNRPNWGRNCPALSIGVPWQMERSGPAAIESRGVTSTMIESAFAQPDRICCRVSQRMASLHRPIPG